METWRLLMRVSLIFLGAALISGCSGNTPSEDIPADQQTALPSSESHSQRLLANTVPTTAQPVPPAVIPRFLDVARQAGIDFEFYNDFVPGRFFLPEVMGGGAAWLDFDCDGWLDLYLLNGCRLKNPDPHQADYVNHLYRNRGDETFEDVTFLSQSGHNGYGQGCAVGDFNADGFPDLYFTNYGANVLLCNNGDGTFEDVTSQAGVGDALWGCSAVWFDADGDADLDLYVVNYLDVRFDNHQTCTFNGKTGYCGPGHYQGVADLLYLNRGDGRFVESAQALGLAAENGKGLAVIVIDFDDDRKSELYVANDMTPNFLFTRSVISSDDSPRPLYANTASAAGCAVSDSGRNEASMGIACADFDSDGRVDIFLTHFYSQKNTLYRNLGNLIFDDDSRRSRIAATSFETLGFGTAVIDYDRDGAADLFVANGHVLGPGHEPNEMKPQLLRNDGTGRFEDVSSIAGPYFHDFWLGRGVASADYDNDGDTDLAVTHLNRPFALLRNDTVTERRFVGLKLTTPTRIPPIGGYVVVSTGVLRLKIPLSAGGSYLSSGDPRLLIGLGDSDQTVAIEIFWPSGRVDRFDHLDVNRYWWIIEGRRPEPLPVSNIP